MPEPRAHFCCIAGCATYPLDEAVFACHRCGGLLEVEQEAGSFAERDSQGWKELFESRQAGTPGPVGSGVWRYLEWVLPDMPPADIVTLGEGGTPLVEARGLTDAWGLHLMVKQCGQSLSGSFKDLGMTVLVSQVHHMRQQGARIPAVACASTGDTSAALAAYGAAAGLRTLVLLPRGKISTAQLVQPLASGARVLAVQSDFDGCMRHVQELVEREGVYLANSKNSLRIEGQKTVAFEIVQALGWQLPDWIAIPGGNLGNVSALVKGLILLRDTGIVDRLPRVLCAQTRAADPLYRSYKNGFAPCEPVRAGATHATAIRIGDPVSFPRAVAALQASSGVVDAVSEAELVDAARTADATGLYVCPQTAAALAAVRRQRDAGVIRGGERIVVVATAHGLKFTEFKSATVKSSEVNLGQANEPIAVDDNYEAVRAAALEGT